MAESRAVLTDYSVHNNLPGSVTDADLMQIARRAVRPRRGTPDRVIEAGIEMLGIGPKGSREWMQVYARVVELWVDLGGGTVVSQCVTCRKRFRSSGGVRKCERCR